MKKFVILFAVFFLAAFILLPRSGNGKYNVSKPVVADGSPLPWPPPPSGGILIADGSPLPPPIPTVTSTSTLIADGSPLPLPPPPPSASYLIALAA